MKECAQCKVDPVAWLVLYPCLINGKPQLDLFPYTREAKARSIATESNAGLFPLYPGAPERKAKE